MIRLIWHTTGCGDKFRAASTPKGMDNKIARMVPQMEICIVSMVGLTNLSKIEKSGGTILPTISATPCSPPRSIAKFKLVPRALHHNIASIIIVHTKYLTNLFRSSFFCVTNIIDNSLNLHSAIFW